MATGLLGANPVAVADMVKVAAGATSGALTKNVPVAAVARVLTASRTAPVSLLKPNTSKAVVVLPAKGAPLRRPVGEPIAAGEKVVEARPATTREAMGLPRPVRRSKPLPAVLPPPVLPPTISRKAEEGRL